MRAGRNALKHVVALFLLCFASPSECLCLPSSSSSSSSSFHGDDGTGVHYVVLSHGYQGSSKDLAVLEMSLKEQALGSLHGSSRCVVLQATCNEGKTRDGVARGGERLAREIERFIERRILEEGEGGESAASISIVGNSLGGLYARYAISKLFQSGGGSFLEVAGRTLLPLTFATTASPWLGTSGHTFFKVPRTAEYAFARSLGQTGMDLFRYNDLVTEMSTSDKFLSPLSKFRNRLCLGNIGRTDFLVPASTSLFLSPGASTKHTRANAARASSSDFLLASYLTERQVHTIDNNNNNSSNKKNNSNNYNNSNNSNNRDRDALCCECIDRLGWEKVSKGIII